MRACARTRLAASQVAMATIQLWWQGPVQSEEATGLRCSAPAFRTADHVNIVTACYQFGRRILRYEGKINKIKIKQTLKLLE